MDSNKEYENDDIELAYMALAGAATFIGVCGAYYLQHLEKKPARNRYLTSRQFIQDLMLNNEDCFNNLRMNIESFDRFVHVLRATSRLHDTVHVNVEEQVAMFLHIVAHNVKNRACKTYFRRSGETISRYFNIVLHAIIGMHDQFIKPPGLDTPREIQDNLRMNPYFKDCVGAIDGTHIPVKVSEEYLPRFRGRKSWPSQNVMAACSFDLKFTYVISGWEGSASDSRILECALNRDYKITCPPGKYYLVDAGYPLLRNFIAPFRNTRYHLNEIRGRVPTTKEELFNHRHSSLRNAIERAFGVLKKRFTILCEEPMFSWQTQVDMVVACCIIHNHIRGAMSDDPLLHDVDRDLEQLRVEEENSEPQLSRINEGREGKRIREEIMNAMWEDFNRNRI